MSSLRATRKLYFDTHEQRPIAMKDIMAWWIDLSILKLSVAIGCPIMRSPPLLQANSEKRRCLLVSENARHIRRRPCRKRKNLDCTAFFKAAACRHEADGHPSLGCEAAKYAMLVFFRILQHVDIVQIMQFHSCSSGNSKESDVRW